MDLKKIVYNQDSIKLVEWFEKPIKGPYPNDWEDVYFGIFNSFNTINNKENLFKGIETSLTAFLKVMKSSGIWTIDGLKVLARKLREAAKFIDNDAIEVGESTPHMEEAARLLSRCFNATISDRREEKESFRKGALAIVNSMFYIYFSMNNLELCVNLIRPLETHPMIDFNSFPRKERTVYNYFRGRLDLLQSDFSSSEKHLLDVFKHSKTSRNRHLTLRYLVPARLLRGVIPNMNILQEIPMYIPLVEAYISGNVVKYNLEIEKNLDGFARIGVLFAWEKAHNIVLRNLFKFVFMIYEDSKIPVDAFRIALSIIGETLSLDEVECIFVTLIYEGKIRAYIHHNRRMVVFSKSNPFPNLQNI